MNYVRALLAALVLALTGCAGLVTILEDPAAADRLLASVEELSGLDASEITDEKRDEMRKACAGLDVADLLGYIPPDIDWRRWCDQTWGRE